MNKLADEFNALPADYQKVIQLAQETHKIEVTPLRELRGGQTGANLFLVSVSQLDLKKIQHLVLKLDHKNAITKMDELERHRIVVDEASATFAQNHIPKLNFNRIELDTAVAIFYNIAGQSLNNYRPLASYQQQSRIEKIFRITNDILLKQWNVNPDFKQAVHPQDVLSTWLGYRLKSGGNIEKFLENTCQIHHDITGLLIQGNVFPNPFVYARKEELWEGVRPIDILIGFQHGDLNIGNILAKFEGKNDALKGYYLIDFALFKKDMPLFYDNLYLQMSYLIRELSRVTFPGWIELVTQFAEHDILDTKKVPVELAGACAIINIARAEFTNWLNKAHSSLTDDLWGQYWLAAVAVGLNYCNKTIISDKERLAGLIFASAHLKRYHQAFGVTLPNEVKHISVDNSQNRIDTVGKSSELYSKAKKINLPTQITPFIGREKEVKGIGEFLRQDNVRLLTLIGPGGTGKTRLSIQSALLLKDHFKDGIYFVDLAPVREANSLYTTIARTVGLKEMSDQPLIEELGRQLQNQKLLFLLDNFEQLTSAAPLIAELLRNCPELSLLVTSREALHIRGEQVFPVYPLALPDVNIKNHPVEQLLQFESIQLFKERASAVNPNFELSNENAPIIATICSRLDGLPLAIELAAARINLFSPQDLLKRLDSCLKLLQGGARDLPVRQQTLEQAIDWSYEMLDTAERKLFALFSVFQSCTIEEFEAVAEGIRQIDETNAYILDVLTSLVGKSLIRRTEQEGGKQRLLMLETIREYAADRLAEDPDFQAKARHKHAVYYADFSQNQWKRLAGNEREAALQEFELDIENVRVAWHYWVTESDFAQLQKLTDSLWLLFHARGWYSAIVDLTTDLLKVLDSTPTTQERSKQEIMLQTSLGRVLMAIKGCTPEVEGIFTQALELCNKYGEIPKSFPILRALASFYGFLGNMEKCQIYGQQILNLAENLDDINMKVEGYLLVGYTTAFSGELRKGQGLMEKGIAIFKPDSVRSRSFKFGNNPGLMIHTTSALCSWMLGYPERSLKFSERAMELADKLDHPSSKIYVLFHTGLLHHYKREYETALKYAETALEIAENHEFEIWKAVVSCLHGAALSATGQVEDGMAAFNHGMTMYSELKTPPVFWPLLLLLKAGLYIQANKPKEVMDIIEETFVIFKQATGNPLLAELYRLKGDVLLITNPNESTRAEDLFEQALEIARKHETKIFELRAAISLNQLWQHQGKEKKGRQILSDTYGKFTEGFTTPDLKEAEKLLAE